jgi:hypothetical protein
MPFRPRFNKYFSGEWNYDSGLGVGLKLIGYPNDLNKFIDLLHGESCNPVATRRILEELKENNVKYTTLMSHLNFDYIGDELKSLGVTMEVIPPAPSDKIQNQELDHLALAIFNGEQQFLYIQMNEKDKADIKNRLEIFRKSFENHNHDFGPYDSDRNKSSKAIDDSRRKKHFHQ